MRCWKRGRVLKYSYSSESLCLNAWQPRCACKKTSRIMSKIIFSFSRVPSSLNVDSNEDCFRLTVLQKKISRREHCYFEIIKMIVDLTNVMLLNLSFVIYDHESSFHRFNVLKFVKELKSTDYHWIVMIYCLAIEHKIYNFSSAYVDALN